MLALFLTLGLLFQTAPAPLTAQQVLDAHRAGVSSAGLLNMIAAADSVATATEPEFRALLQAGVPPAVVDAFRARLAPPAPTEAGPDDPRLADIVRLVRAGLSEELISQQIRATGQVYKPSIRDLIFLNANGVSEAIIGELIATGSTPAPETAAPSSFGPLLRMTGFLKKDAPGTLNMKERRLEWLDGKKVERNFALEIASIKTAGLLCSPRPEGNFCYAIDLELFNGDSYEFRDLNWESGENAQTLSLFSTLKKGYPQIIFHERVK